MTELLEDDKLGALIDSLTALPSGGGRFEIIVNDELVFSKLATGRHAEPGEIRQLISDMAKSN